jgi:hypothetical protein
MQKTIYELTLKVIPILSQWVGLRRLCQKGPEYIDKMFDDLALFVDTNPHKLLLMFSEEIDTDPVIFKTVWASVLVLGYTEEDDGDMERLTKWPQIDWAHVYSEELHQYLNQKLEKRG